MAPALAGGGGLRLRPDPARLPPQVFKILFLPSFSSKNARFQVLNEEIFSACLQWRLPGLRFAAQTNRLSLPLDIAAAQRPFL